MGPDSLMHDFDNIDDVVLWMRKNHVAQYSFQGLSLVLDPLPVTDFDENTPNASGDFFQDGVAPRLRMRK